MQAQQGYLGNQQNMALRALQMKKMQEELAQQEAWKKMMMGGAQGGTYETQGGEMLSQPAPSLFDDLPPQARAMVGQMGPQAGSKWMLESQFGTPSDIKVAEWYRNATPEQKAAFDRTKRAEQFLKLGDRVVAPTPGDPGTPRATYTMGLPPQDQPSVRGAQSAAVVSGKAEAERAFNMMDAGEVISAAREYLTGAATGTKPTASGMGSLADTAAGFFGSSPQGAKEADAMRAIGGALVAKMPRMEGPQSDRDMLMYREMSGQVGDASIPIERRLMALKEVERLWAKYDKGSGQSGRKSTATEYDYIPGKGLVPRQ